MKITFEARGSIDREASRKEVAARNEALAETARKEIDGLRGEVNVRVQQRDNAITGYLAASAVIAAAAFKEPRSLEMLLIIPTLSPAVAAIVSQHHVVIGRREAVIKKKLRPLLVDVGAAAAYEEQGREDMDKRELRNRHWAHVISLFVPAALALIINGKAALLGFAFDRGLSIAWIAALVGAVGAGYYVWNSHAIRKGLLESDGKDASAASRTR